MLSDLNEKCIVYCARTSVLRDAALYRTAYEAASEERRLRADRVASGKNRRLLLGAEILLRHALSDVGFGGEAPEFVYGANGKPYLKDCGDVYFNLSHSGEYVLCALSDREVGCDIEKLRKADVKLAKRYFCPEEYDHILSAGDEARQRELFFRYWTLKESFIKTTGQGLHLPLNAFCIQMDGKRAAAQQRFDGEAYSFAEFRTVRGYRCAACIRAENRNAEFRFADLRDFLEMSNA